MAAQPLQNNLVHGDHRRISVDDFRTSTCGWKSEREFVDFLEVNLAQFAEEELGASYLSHVREWYLTDLKPFGANKPRIDLMVRLKDGRRIGIECKRPTGSFSDISRSISQLLSYSVIANQNNAHMDQLYLLTTQYDEVLYQVITKYELPIKVIVFSRDQRAVMA
ncbi:hypothetical protein QFZ60_001583 [Arthrobacter sp. B2I5]|uniref:hypothetical protein n=1 Tax=Arthrobacter sp. B2I5 TaxID=3042266 RepID=UPI0027887604|nr:hypothetical protein [Arthrobacter sp. B2I5]MDQ0825410.1 hypothetical protein [Arthrobacter sp. B2I5]